MLSARAKPAKGRSSSHASMILCIMAKILDLWRGFEHSIGARRRKLLAIAVNSANLAARRKGASEFLSFVPTMRHIETLESRRMLAGWTALNSAAPAGIGTMMLLPDGTIMA